MKCCYQVPNHGGYTWHTCAKPAKATINGAPLCGIHKRSVEAWQKRAGRPDGLPFSVKPPKEPA